MSRTLVYKIKLYGAISAAIISCFMLVALVYGVGDKYGGTPYVQQRVLPIIQDYKAKDSVKWCKNEEEHRLIRERLNSEYKVIMTFQRTTMTAGEIQRATDALVRDTTIPRELIYP